MSAPRAMTCTPGRRGADVHRSPRLAPARVPPKQRGNNHVRVKHDSDHFPGLIVIRPAALLARRTAATSASIRRIGILSKPFAFVSA